MSKTVQIWVWVWVAAIASPFPRVHLYLVRCLFILHDHTPNQGLLEPSGEDGGLTRSKTVLNVPSNARDLTAPRGSNSDSGVPGSAPLTRNPTLARGPSIGGPVRGLSVRKPGGPGGPGGAAGAGGSPTGVSPPPQPPTKGL
jgi:hypothetical protein